MSTIMLSERPYEIRKPYVMGRCNKSVRINIPKKLLKKIGYKDGEYIKCYLSGTDKIVVERLPE